MMNRLKRVIIKEEFVALTGDMCKAIILNQFIYWSERVNDFDKFIAEEKIRSEQSSMDMIIEPTNGWIYKTAEELSEETMLGMAPNTILRHVKALLEKGWLDERYNPNHKWDRTKQYRVNLLKINQDLVKIGYVLQDYKVELPFSKTENAFSKMENAKSILENGSSKMENRIVQNGKAIPEITTKGSFNHSSIHHKKEDDRARVKTAEGNTENVSGGVDSCVDNKSSTESVKSILKNAGFEGLPVEVEYISKWFDVLSPEMFKYAVNKAVLNGIRSLPYIAGIFEDWVKKGIRTVEQAERETRYDSILSKKKNQGQGRRFTKLPDSQVFKDHPSRQGG
ncbi:Replication initiation and membrane attachment [Pelotomaculum schinkii]|uniref:Replication initiation and membrane attachment n=2 Tax=Pelotomaculum schinkii TaxID=78350 RepID=A0A4Y7R7T5_9FIRM|nr:Replication initiation and membrane attachment [Pelotomaculum schinkii]